MWGGEDGRKEDEGLRIRGGQGENGGRMECGEENPALVSDGKGGTHLSDPGLGFILWDKTLKGKELKTEARGGCVLSALEDSLPAPHQAACGSQGALKGKNSGATDLKARRSE